MVGKKVFVILAEFFTVALSYRSDMIIFCVDEVACVPQMQKGNETARTVHIGANFAGIGMFLWQLQSGIPILLKVWEKTSWP